MSMKFIENINDFGIELELNESLAKGFFDKIRKFFLLNFKKDGWRRYMKYLDKKGVLKKHGVEYIPYVKVPDTKIPKDAKELLESNRVPLDHPDPDVKNVLPGQLAKQIKIHIKLREPLFVWGAPGVGKTEIFRTVGHELKKDVLVFNLALREPTDFIGLPSIDKDKKRTIYNLPDIFPPGKGTPEAKKDKYGGLMFFDEMNRAHGMVLRASLQFILDKKFDTYILADNWDIFAAGNRPIDTEDLTPLGEALTNRFSHINLTTNPDEWEKWATSDAGKDSDGEFMIDPLLLNFMRFNEENLHFLPMGKAPTAWASPRSWTMASREWIKTKKTNPNLSDDEIEFIFAKRVGRAMAREFIGFLTLIKHIKMEDIKLVYTNPGKAPLPPRERKKYKAMDTWAMLGAIAQHKRKGDLTIKEFSNAVDYIIRMNEGEFATAFIGMLLRYNKHVTSDPKISPILKKWHSHYRKDVEWNDKIKSIDNIKVKK